MAFVADLLLSGAEIFHPIFKKFVRADLYIKDGKIFHIDFEPSESAKEASDPNGLKRQKELKGEKSSVESSAPTSLSAKSDNPQALLIDDWSNKQIIPGFIDIHMHIESSMLTPISFNNEVLKRGVTTVVAEPHEIANVYGIEGIKHFIEAGKKSPMDIFIALPSSVPSTRPDLETTGGILSEHEMMELYKMPEVISVGEVMNYRDIIDEACDLPIARFLRDLEKFDPRATIEGHCPQLTGFELSRFLWHRIQGDHTEHSLEEIKDRVRRGMFLEIQMKMLREEILSYLCENNLYEHFAFITDDTMPDSLVYEGQLDAVMRKAIELGVPRDMVFYCTSETPARRMKLVDRGRLLPGYLADCVVIEKNAGLDILAVYKNGVKVEIEKVNVENVNGAKGEVEKSSAENSAETDSSKCNSTVSTYPWPSEYKNSIKIPKLSDEDFVIRKEDILKNFSVFTSEPKNLSDDLASLVAETKRINNPFEISAELTTDVKFSKKFELTTVVDFASNAELDTNSKLATDAEFTTNSKLATKAESFSSSNTPYIKVPLRIMDLKDGSTRIAECHLDCLYDVSENKVDLEKTAEELGEKLAMLVSINRYSAKGEKSFALVSGDMIKKGAIASTWSHDAHNLMVMGLNSHDMQIAANRLIEIGGGIIAVEDGKILAELNLEIAGIVTESSAESCADKLLKLREAWQHLGYNHYNPFMSFGTLGLLVSPSLKLSDKGLVAVEHASRIPLLNTPDVKVDSGLHEKFTQYLLQESEALDVAPLMDYKKETKISFPDREAKIEVKVTDLVPRSPGRVPMYRIDILLDEKKIGNIVFRTENWPNVLYAGNIGYTIDPSFRGLGLLEKVLPLLKDLSFHHGLKSWIISNMEWNYASRKVCEKLGATYLACFELPKDNDMRIEGKEEKVNSFYYPLDQV